MEHNGSQKMSFNVNAFALYSKKWIWPENLYFFFLFEHLVTFSIERKLHIQRLQLVKIKLLSQKSIQPQNTSFYCFYSKRSGMLLANQTAPLSAWYTGHYSGKVHGPNSDTLLVVSLLCLFRAPSFSIWVWLRFMLQTQHYFLIVSQWLYSKHK